MSDPVTRLNAALSGRYAIERELGEGGMATVYLADDLKHERKVALKVLKPARSSARKCVTAMAVVAVCSTVSCIGPFAPCPQVTRFVSGMIEADLSATGAVDGTFGLVDSRHDDDPRFPDEFSWDVYFAPTNSADSLVTDVHLHEAATDDILYTFPVSVERDPADPDVFAWIVSVNPIFPMGLDRLATYQGSEPFDLLYGLVSSDGTYIDVHTVAHPAGARGRVTVTDSHDWVEFCD